MLHTQGFMSVRYSLHSTSTAVTYHSWRIWLCHRHWSQPGRMTLPLHCIAERQVCGAWTACRTRRNKWRGSFWTLCDRWWMGEMEVRRRSESYTDYRRVVCVLSLITITIWYVHHGIVTTYHWLYIENMIAHILASKQEVMCKINALYVPPWGNTA